MTVTILVRILCWIIFVPTIMSGHWIWAIILAWFGTKLTISENGVIV